MIQLSIRVELHRQSRNIRTAYNIEYLGYRALGILLWEMSQTTKETHKTTLTFSQTNSVVKVCLS